MHRHCDKNKQGNEEFHDRGLRKHDGNFLNWLLVIANSRCWYYDSMLDFEKKIIMALLFVVFYVPFFAHI